MGGWVGVWRRCGETRGEEREGEKESKGGHKAEEREGKEGEGEK